MKQENLYTENKDLQKTVSVTNSLLNPPTSFVLRNFFLPTSDCRKSLYKQNFIFDNKLILCYSICKSNSRVFISKNKCTQKLLKNVIRENIMQKLVCVSSDTYVCFFQMAYTRPLTLQTFKKRRLRS